MQKEKKYRLSFKGDILPGFETQAVKAGLEKLFGLEANEVDPIFNGKKIFKRSGLNKYTADQYVAAFKRVGAQCNREQESAEQPFTTVNKKESLPVASVMKQNTNSQNHCPKCQSVNINNEQCLDCGIYIEKFKQQLAKKAEIVDESEEDEEGYGKQENMQKAIRIIKYVTIFMLIVFTADNYIEDNSGELQYIVDEGFGLGIIPYILGHIGLVFGCYYLSLAKGRSGGWALLGFGSLPGLGVLLLLPDKHETSSEFKTKIFAVLMILLSIYWVVDYSNKSLAMEQYLTENVILKEQRNEYPSLQQDTDPELYSSEIIELNRYLDRGFELLSKYDYRSRDVNVIAERMFSESTRLFIWVNYQQYLQYRNGERGIDYLHRENISKIQNNFYKQVKRKVTQVNLSGLSRKFTDWFYGYNPYLEKEYAFMGTFSGEISSIREKLFELRALNKGEVKSPEFSFENIKLPKFSNVKSSIQGDIIVFDFSSHNLPLMDKPLAIALFYRVYKRYSVTERKEVDQYFPVQVQISPDFPNKYLAGDLSVFKPVDIAPQ